MKLGWWRDREGAEWEITKYDNSRKPSWGTQIGHLRWADDGASDHAPCYDLIEFLRPLEELAPELNSAVKAAENMVRRLEQHHSALQNQANEACEILVQARRELERLEKECEVKP